MASSTPPADTPSTPPLAKLPPEIMRLIAEQAHQQDRAYWERHHRFRWSNTRDAVFNATKTAGRSLNTLFLTSRAWNAAATPFLFMHLDDQDCTNVLFRRCILPKYGEFVQIVTMRCDEGHPEANIPELVISLPFFRRLRRLEIGFCTVDALLSLGRFTTSKLPEKDLAICRQEFRNAVMSVTDLKLSDSEPSSLVWLLESFPNLRRLHLSGFRCFDKDEDSAVERAGRVTIERAVAKYSGLTHLAIEDHQESLCERDAVPIGFGDGWQEQDLAWSSRPTLRYLRIARYGLNWDSNLWSFVQHFAETLESLDIYDFEKHVHAEDNEAVGWPLKKEEINTPVAFPKLTHACIVGRGESVARILTLLASAPLRHLRLPLLLPKRRRDQKHEISPLFSTLLRLHSTTLQSIIVSSQDCHSSGYLDDSLLEALARRCKQNQVAFNVEEDWDVWSDRESEREALNPASSWEVGVRCDGIEQVANFALNYAGRARAMGDIYAAETLVALLEPVRSLMMQEEL